MTQIQKKFSSPITLREFGRYFIVSVLAAFYLFSPVTALASSVEDVVTVLEKWTSFHWGRDCLIWVVHYSDEVIDPWVEAESAKAKFTESQKNEYRKAFVTELRMDDTEPFLVSVYAFGASPLDLKPLGDKISLIGSDGSKLKPVSYERVFDEPISGMIQGLVFFPKQPDKDFSLSLRGTGAFDERIFSFRHQPEEVYDVSPAVDSEPKQSDLIVIDMPPAPEPPAKKEVEVPAPVVIEELPKQEPVAAPAEQIAENQTAQDNSNLYVSKEKTLQNFINSWIANDAPAMYDMLSEDTRKLYSSETFEKEVKKAADFRRGLISGYKIDWVGEERAKVTTTKRLLIIRTLISRTLGVVRSGKDWRIVW